MAEPRKLARREFIQAASIGAVALITFANRSVRSLLSGRIFSEAHAQDSVRNLKPFSLRKLREMDSVMDKKYKRDFWETKDGCFVSAKTDGSNNNHEIYLEVTGGIFPTTLNKELAIVFPVDRKKPNDKRTRSRIDLQKLCDYYGEICAPSGCGSKERVWLKVIFDVDNKGVAIFATFVDSKPRPGDSSDIKIDYPVLALRYWKEKNGVSQTEHYLRIENGER